MSLRFRLAQGLAAGGLLEAAESMKDWQWFRRAKRFGEFSQHGEDRFVLDYFSGRSGTYIDVGANHPYRLSNTYLLYCSGWRGVTIEPIPHLWEKHRKLRPEDVSLNCGVGAQHGRLTFFEMFPKVLSTFDKDTSRNLTRLGEAVVRRTFEIEVVTLADVCKEHFGNRPLSLLSVDVEGFDFEVFQGMDWSVVRPDMIVFETFNWGEVKSDAGQIDELLVDQGFRHLKDLGCNRFFVDDKSVTLQTPDFLAQ